MKTVIAASFFALTCLLATPGMAAGEHEHGSHTTMPMPAPTETQPAEGLVKKIDKGAGKVTIAHGPLINLGMPAMTMAFRVKNPAWLDQMKDGNKIRFVTESIHGVLTIVQFEPAQ